jgi:hypothetical protein
MWLRLPRAGRTRAPDLVDVDEHLFYGYMPLRPRPAREAAARRRAAASPARRKRAGDRS